MSTFDDREKGFERKYIHDQEIAFKINAKRNKLLGLWAAALLGKHGADADAYAKEVAMADLGGDENHKTLIKKLLHDFKAADIAVTEKEILVEMERLLPEAQKKVLGN